MPARKVAAVAVAAIAAAAPSAPATAATCADRVLADWSDGRITGTYAPACYRMAIAGLPDDLDAYTTAREDIERALRERLRELEAAPARGKAPARALAGARPATTQARPPAATTPAPTTAAEPATTPSEAAPAASDERGGSRWRQLLPVLVVGLLLALGVPALLRR
ncbi:MAG: hypothetical protein ACM33B_05450 [Pseudomonadota bacterium]